MEGAGPKALNDREQRVCKEKLAKYKGSVKVWITHLDFPNPIRPIDRRVIVQLKRDFEGEGCIKERPEHRVPGMIDDSTLQQSLEKMEITLETFKATSRDNPPHLRLRREAKLECLHGQHRVLAAKEYLVPSLRWWIVDLYSTDLDQDTKQTLREGYSYSAKYTSGEIFRYIRLCHYDRDTLGVQRWRGRLSDSQNQFLSQLLKRGMLISALDSVLHIQGLWRTFYVGSLDVFLNLRCDDEVVRYIESIKKGLNRVIGDDMVTMMNTDPLTIELIQLTAPALSNSDFEHIQKHMGSLFPAVTDPTKRTELTQRLLTNKKPILSLYTLIKDIRYLKQPAAILGALLPKARKETLRQRYHFHFTGVESSSHNIELQQSVLSYTTISGDQLDPFDISYQQLWLCACRVWKHPSAYGRLEIANLAHRLGFSSKEIEREMGKDPGQVAMEKAVLEALNVLRPNEKVPFDANQARQLITSFHDYITKSMQAPPKSSLPTITVAGLGEPLARRCGSSSADTQDLEHLFLDKINAPLRDHLNGGNEISSFYIKRSRHIAFFGAVHHSQLSILSVTEASVEQRNTSLVSHAGVLTRRSSSPTPRQEHLNVSQESQIQLVGHVTPPSTRVVRFKELNAAVLEVPYEKAAVNEQARVYANQGKKLSVKEGGHFIWQHCFDILSRTKQSTVQVTTSVRPVLGKRRNGRDLPESLQPKTKEVFDQNMEATDDEDEEDEL